MANKNGKNKRNPQGRPMTFYIVHEGRAYLEGVAKETDRSVSQVLRKLIDGAIDRKMPEMFVNYTGDAE